MSRPAMFGPDPIDFLDPSPYEPLAYYGHIVIGLVALAAVLLGFYSRKGGATHRYAGYVFMASVGIVCLTSISMLSRNFIPPLFMAVFTAAYAVAGGWLALQRRSLKVRTAEIALSLFLLAGIFLFMTRALPAVSAGIVPPFAPFVIMAIPCILLAGDLNWFVKRESQKALRWRRHVNRMIWAFVVVFRAPLVELAAAGLPISQPVTIFGPILLGLVMLVYFQQRYPIKGTQKPSVSKSRSAADR